MKEIPPKSDSANTQYQKTIKAKQRRLVFIENESSVLIRDALSTRAITFKIQLMSQNLRVK